MRITYKLIQDRVLLGLKSSVERLSKTHKRVATTKNIDRPSEDPVGCAKAIGFYKDLYNIKQILRNAEGAQDLFSYTDTILEKVGDLLVDLRNKATQMATDTVSVEARKAVAKEIDIMIDEMLSFANAQYAGRYIFSGNRTTDPPYRADLAIDKIPYEGKASNPRFIGNLDSSATNGDKYVKQVVIYDQLHVPHTVEITFEKTNTPNEWTWSTNIGSGTGTLIFNSNGTFASVSNNAASFPSWGEQVDPGPPPTYSDLAITFDFSGLTQFDRMSSIRLETPMKDGNIEYTGDQGEFMLNVELGESPIALNFPGTRIFGTGDGMDSYGIFRVMKDLKRALETDHDPDIPERNYSRMIQEQIEYIDHEIDRVATVRGELGTRMSRVQTSITNLRDLELITTDELSKIVEVDMSEEAGVFIASQAAYQAALQAASSILRLPSLIDYLR